MSERQRARIWWREAAACSEGESMPDLTPENFHVLNSWMVSAEHKYRYPSAGDGKRGRPEKSREEKLANKAAGNGATEPPSVAFYSRVPRQPLSEIEGHNGYTF